MGTQRPGAMRAESAVCTFPADSRVQDGSAGVLHRLRDPAAAVITVTGLFHLWRGAPVDGWIFLAIAVALVAGDLVNGRWPGRRPVGKTLPPRALAALPVCRPGPRARDGPEGAVPGRVLRAAAVAGAAAGYGWLVSGWIRADWAVWTALVIPGVVAGMLAWPQRAAPSAGSRPAGRWAWAGVAVLVCVWQLAAFLLQQPGSDRLHDHPTVSLLIDPLVDSQPGRGVALAVWLAGGYVLLRRARAVNTVTKGADGGHAE